VRPPKTGAPIIRAFGLIEFALGADDDNLSVLVNSTRRTGKPALSAPRIARVTSASVKDRSRVIWAYATTLPAAAAIRAVPSGKPRPDQRPIDPHGHFALKAATSPDASSQLVAVGYDLAQETNESANVPGSGGG
jgi:hypothetical protein